MLTATDLKNMKPGNIIAHGTMTDNTLGINIVGSGIMIGWIAIRGKGMHDWAIYYAEDWRSIEWIREQGDKIHDFETIKRLVPCTQEALDLYRR